MNDKIEALMQVIGKLAIDSAEGLSGKLLLYAEVADGYVAPSLFFEMGEKKTVTHKHPIYLLSEAIETLWYEYQKCQNGVDWRAMECLIDNERFSFDFTYPDQINEETEGVRERREKAVVKYFGDVFVDYSNP